jgi:hypothetical protein
MEQTFCPIDKNPNQQQNNNNSIQAPPAIPTHASVDDDGGGKLPAAASMLAPPAPTTGQHLQGLTQPIQLYQQQPNHNNTTTTQLINSIPADIKPILDPPPAQVPPPNRAPSPPTDMPQPKSDWPDLPPFVFHESPYNTEYQNNKDRAHAICQWWQQCHELGCVPNHFPVWDRSKKADGRFGLTNRQKPKPKKKTIDLSSSSKIKFSSFFSPTPNEYGEEQRHWDHDPFPYWGKPKIDSEVVPVSK